MSMWLSCQAMCDPEGREIAVMTVTYRYLVAITPHHTDSKFPPSTIAAYLRYFVDEVAAVAVEAADEQMTFNFETDAPMPVCEHCGGRQGEPAEWEWIRSDGVHEWWCTFCVQEAGLEPGPRLRRIPPSA